MGSDRFVVLDLNGKTVNREATSDQKGTVITVDGNLTVDDTVESGKITGGYGDDGAGGVYVSSGGTFTLKRGEISRNTSTNCGGGVAVDGGTFNLYSGEIKDNTAK